MTQPPPTFDHPPEPWFAWRPVRLTNGKFAWLRTVTRTEFVNSMVDYGYRYTETQEN